MTKKICTPAAMIERLSASRSTQSDTDLLQAAITEATELARAYREQDPEARRAAEEVLYTINIHGTASPPAQPVVAAVWTILTEACVHSALDGLAPREPLGPDEMIAALDETLDQVDQRDHTFVDEVLAADSDRGLRLYYKNWSSHIYNFTNQLIALAQRATGNAKNVLLNNIADELQGATEHRVLRERFFAAIDVSVDVHQVIRDPEQTTEALGLLNFRHGIVHAPDPIYAFGAFYTVEAVLPQLARRLVPGLRKRGFDDHTLEYILEHGEADIEHKAEWGELIKGMADSPERRARAVAGGRAQLAVRHKLFDAMRRKAASS